MAKLTAGLFAQLPDELQQLILKKVPVHGLNDVEVLVSGSDSGKTKDEASSAAAGILMPLTRRESLCCIMELASAYISEVLPENVPSEVCNEMELALIKMTIERVQTIINEHGGER